MVLLGSFISFFLADGWAYSFGVLFPRLLDFFDEGKGKTSLIAALLYGVPLILSPIVCALTSCYGCRPVAIIGGFLLAGSMILSIFVTSLTQMCVTVGLLGSLGLAMTYLPALIIVTFYFEKRRGIATGLAVTGSGLGSIFFPLIIEFLLDRYAWRGFLLIIGALCLHVVFAGCLFRPPPMGVPSDLDSMTDDDSMSDKQTELPHGKNISRLHNTILLPRLHKTISKSIQSCSNLPQEEKFHRHVFSMESDLSLHTPGRFNGAVAIDMDLYSEHPKFVSAPDLHFLDNDPTIQLSTRIVEHRNACSQKNSACQNFVLELKLIVISMFDKSLAKNWAFLLFCAANFILYLWVGVPYIFLIDRAVELLLSGDLFFLASIIGIGRTFGQLVIGFLGDIQQINCNVLYAVSVIIIGIATVVVPVCNTYLSLAVYAGVFGFFVSSTYAIQMMCVVDVVGLERSTSAFGLLQLVQGLATILGTPLAGWLFDVTGAYDPTFYTAGAWMIISGVLLLPVGRLIRLNNQPQQY